MAPLNVTLFPVNSITEVPGLTVKVPTVPQLQTIPVPVIVMEDAPSVRVLVFVLFELKAFQMQVFPFVSKVPKVKVTVWFVVMAS